MDAHCVPLGSRPDGTRRLEHSSPRARGGSAAGPGAPGGPAAREGGRGMSDYRDEAARIWQKKAADSARAVQESERARIAFGPIPLSAVGPSEPPAWVWQGHIARGHITLFIGLWKAGK